MRQDDPREAHTHAGANHVALAVPEEDLEDPPTKPPSPWNDRVSLHHQDGPPPILSPSRRSLAHSIHVHPPWIFLTRGERCVHALFNWIRSLTQQWFTHVVLILALLGYAVCGGLAFQYIEAPHEERLKIVVDVQRHNLSLELWRLAQVSSRSDFHESYLEMIYEYESQLYLVYAAGLEPNRTKWSLFGSVFYCGTVISTIGYGNIAPSTETGRALTMVYAAIGIPLLLMVLADFGKLFTRSIKVVWAFVRRFYYTGSCRRVRMAAPVKAVGKIMGADGTVGGEDEEPPPYSVDEKFDLPVSIALTLLLLYVLLGGLIFIQWEEWTYFQAVYFVFISLSTIGFGDFVPRHPSYLMATFLYLLFGLALTSMCINVIQESLTNTFREATLKIGTRMGLGLEEGQPPAVAVEMAAVHDSDKHRKKD